MEKCEMEKCEMEKCEMEKCETCNFVGELEKYIGRSICSQCAKDIEEGRMCYVCMDRDNNCSCDYCGSQRCCYDCADTSRNAKELYFCFNSECVSKYLWKNGIESSDSESW
jgi:hypothetical protein